MKTCISTRTTCRCCPPRASEGSSYHCTLALRSYPTSTEEPALLRHLGEKSGVLLHIYNRQVTPAEEGAILHNAANKSRMERGNTNDLKQSITAEASLQDVAALITSMHRSREPLVHCAVFLELCFHGGSIPINTPAEYRAYIQEMRTSLSLLDGAVQTINTQTETGNRLEPNRVKAVFYALYFGAPGPSRWDHRKFADCFVNYETRTETVTYRDDDRVWVTEVVTHTVAVPVGDIGQVYRNIAITMGVTATQGQKDNAAGVYRQFHQVAAGEVQICLRGAAQRDESGPAKLFTSGMRGEVELQLWLHEYKLKVLSTLLEKAPASSSGAWI